MNYVQLLKSTSVFKQKFFFGLQFVDPSFKLIFLSTMELLNFSLDLEQLKDKTIK
jgi:hypothetical protein